MRAYTYGDPVLTRLLGKDLYVTPIMVDGRPIALGVGSTAWLSEDLASIGARSFQCLHDEKEVQEKMPRNQEVQEKMPRNQQEAMVDWVEKIA